MCEQPLFSKNLNVSPYIKAKKEQNKKFPRVDGNWEVTDFCQKTGKYIGAAFVLCNLFTGQTLSNCLPIAFHKIGNMKASLLY